MIRALEILSVALLFCCGARRAADRPFAWAMYVNSDRLMLWTHGRRAPRVRAVRLTELGLTPDTFDVMPERVTALRYPPCQAPVEGVLLTSTGSRHVVDDGQALHLREVGRATCLTLLADALERLDDDRRSRV